MTSAPPPFAPDATIMRCKWCLRPWDSEHEANAGRVHWLWLWRVRGRR